MVDGAWHVFRFSLGIAEDPTWTQDGVGWTSCYFNRPADLATAAKAYGGVEDPDKGGFVFKTPAEAAEAAKLLGQTDLDVAEVFADRKTKLKAHKDGWLTIEIDAAQATTTSRKSLWAGWPARRSGHGSIRFRQSPKTQRRRREQTVTIWSAT